MKCEICGAEIACSCGSLEKQEGIRDKDVKKFAKKLAKAFEKNKPQIDGTVSNS